jgi:hypothetical protein
LQSLTRCADAVVLLLLLLLLAIMHVGVQVPAVFSCC